MVNLQSVARLKNSHQGSVNYPQACQRKARGLNQQVKERCLALNLSEGRTFPFFSPGSVSLVQSVLFALLLSEGRTFPFFHLVLPLLGSQSYLGCCYLKAEPFFFFFFFFHLVLSLLGSLFILDSFFFQNKLVFSMKFCILFCRFCFCLGGVCP